MSSDPLSGLKGSNIPLFYLFIPVRLCAPSQKGIFFEAPQRQIYITSPVSICFPSESLRIIFPEILSGPFSLSSNTGKSVFSSFISISFFTFIFYLFSLRLFFALPHTSSSLFALSPLLSPFLSLLHFSFLSPYRLFISSLKTHHSKLSSCASHHSKA